MSPAEYIESGMLELYASGAVSPAEKQEVEQMAAQHPQIREALDSILADFENYANLHAVQPDPQLRDRILNHILQPGQQEEKGKIVSISKPEPAPSRWKNLAIAASVILLISIGTNIYIVYHNNETMEVFDKYANDQANALVTTQELLRQSQTDLDYYQQTMAFLRKPATQSIILNTTDTAHPMKAMVHWNMDSKMVAIDPMTLPVTTPEQMYVLWAVIDGQAVNEGAFTVSDSSAIVMLKAIPNAEAFAISLETKPDVPQHEGPIYVLGKPVAAQP